MSKKNKLSEKQQEKMYSDFLSQDLLTAVDHYDQIRYCVADQDDFKPPEHRFHLMELHDRFFKILGYGSDELDIDDTWGKLEDIRYSIETIVENGEKLLEILDELSNVTPLDEQE